MMTLEAQLTAQIATNDRVLAANRKLLDGTRTQAQFLTGWRKASRLQPVATCANEQQERGWWAWWDESDGAFYEFEGQDWEPPFVLGGVVLVPADYLPY